ncbi:hypothetical protein BY458DRAFT_509045 [Sporodiniella umbellata]|nr:hypothetical protein BY458DRAFT_509045 [Sporodiniella umbellata]
MSEDYEAICEQLNALTISYLSKMNDYSEHCKESSKCFQKGFVDLAHAKYAMGTQVISHYSYDKRMRANTIL